MFELKINTISVFLYFDILLKRISGRETFGPHLYIFILFIIVNCSNKTYFLHISYDNIHSFSQKITKKVLSSQVLH